MAKTIASCKSKGRRLQQRIAKLIQESLDLNPDDVVSTSMGVPGEDIKLSTLARTRFPFSVESKNTEKLNIWAALTQAESENRSGKPLVVFSRNRSEDYCALKFSDFMELLKTIEEQKNKIQELYEIAAGEAL